MILRCQCRRLLSRSSTTTTIQSIQYNSAFPIPSLNRSIHSTPIRRAQEPDDDADEGIDDTADVELGDFPPSTPSLKTVTGSRSRNARFSPDKSSAPQTEKKTLEQIDLAMSVEDLGLRSVARTRKRQFIRWLKQEGAKYEYFPQHVVMAIEEKRVEKARKRAEYRMFARMNRFYDSLTIEEIKEGQLVDTGVRTKGMKPERIDALRPLQESPTPFEKLMSGEEELDELTTKEIESRVLKLLKQHDENLHTMYKNYIDWSDYQIQKRTMWFSFPDKPLYAPIIDRIRGPDPESLPTPEETTSTETETEDLAYYYGPRIPENTLFPILPEGKSHYLNPAEDTPFLLNRSFKPWRPISHATRMRMFHAWREGLGLRNIAWLGGVSWRRADGIIGILKKEWEFVEKGGKFELSMAKYMETLLSHTPLQNPVYGAVNLSRPRDLPRFPIERPPNKWERRDQHQEPLSSAEDLTKPDIPLADPELQTLSNIPTTPRAPFPTEQIFIKPQVGMQDTAVKQYAHYIEALEQRDINNHTWLASQKEPLVEIPVKRTKQYFALIGEMEEYPEKRAAKALDGVDGRTMGEKEKGIKLFERVFGGLRSLGGREKFQGITAWRRHKIEQTRRRLAKGAKGKVGGPVTTAVESGAVMSPVEIFRQEHALEKVSGTSGKTVERVVWRFEDVSWVKQRTTKPRKQSYAGTLDKRVQLESGVERYGPFGIGGGVEGVGGVKRIIERGKDGKVRLEKADTLRKQARREIVV